MHVYRGQKMAEVFQDRNAKTLRDDEDGSFHSSKCKLRANACCSPGLNSVKSSSSPGPRLELPTSAKSNLFDTSGSQFLAWSGMPREGNSADGSCAETSVAQRNATGRGCSAQSSCTCLRKIVKAPKARQAHKEGQAI